MKILWDSSIANCQRFTTKNDYETRKKSKPPEQNL
jgi:hypothetical protein